VEVGLLHKTKILSEKAYDCELICTANLMSTTKLPAGRFCLKSGYTEMIDRHSNKPHIMILAGEKCLPLVRASLCTLDFADASGNVFIC
jgi:hypothetical protein